MVTTSRQYFWWDHAITPMFWHGHAVTPFFYVTLPTKKLLSLDDFNLPPTPANQLQPTPYGEHTSNLPSKYYSRWSSMGSTLTTKSSSSARKGQEEAWWATMTSRLDGLGWVTMRMDKSGQATSMRRMVRMWHPTKRMDRAGDDNKDDQGGQW